MGKMYIIGLGPGAPEYMTERARNAITDSDVICGYTLYVSLIKPMFPDKETYTSGMRGEIERCRYALSLAQSGKTVSLVCSGDAGVYGMASPVLELLPEYEGIEVSVIPGISAVLSGSALLGAAVGHDFCVISLSDLMTPWELIEKRLRLAAEGDMVISLYNPSSRHRPDYLQRACDVLLEQKSGETVCGISKNIGRDGERCEVMTLSKLRNTEVDMFTTVFIGSSKTKNIGGYMVTPRGYEA